jgi:hypothetical protein
MDSNYLLNGGKSFPVLAFCKENGIECTWDFSNSDNTDWTEIFIDNILVMQIQSTTTVKQFIEVIQRIEKDFNDKCSDVEGDDFWFVIDNKKYFDAFIKKYGYLFNNKQRNMKNPKQLELEQQLKELLIKCETLSKSEMDEDVEFLQYVLDELTDIQDNILKFIKNKNIS